MFKRMLYQMKCLVILIIIFKYLKLSYYQNTLCSGLLGNEFNDIEKYQLKMMIYDCFNEALDYMRPFGIRGKPVEWKTNSKKLN